MAIVYSKSVKNTKRWECLLKTPITAAVSTMKIFARPAEYKKVTGEIYSEVKRAENEEGLCVW